ncbi:MAG: hypothetical protein JOY68_07675 [Candidatus Dormibacteraeota bacterium]|nr:hypothetical protein [Candidatus Dormibacteraeota bacterium]
MNDSADPTYVDDEVSCGRTEVVIRWYYPWGSKRIPYQAIRGVSELPLTGINKVRRWRLWGSGDFLHWWNLDLRRTGKTLALVIDVGRRVRPTITPDDPATAERVIKSHLVVH